MPFKEQQNFYFCLRRKSNLSVQEKTNFSDKRNINSLHKHNIKITFTRRVLFRIFSNESEKKTL